MSELPAAAGKGFDHKLGEETYHFSLITAGDLATMMDHVVSLRPSAVDALVGRLEKFTDEQQKEMIAAALAEDRKAAPRLTEDEWEGFLHSSQSGQYALWLSLRTTQPELTQDDVADLIEPIDNVELLRVVTRLLQASGLTSRAKKNGRAKKAKRKARRSSTSPGKTTITT